MQSFSSLLSIFGLLIALLQTSVLAAPIALDKNIEQLSKRTFAPVGGSPYDPASASDSELVLQWLTDKGASYANPEKLIFWSGSEAEASAERFVRANPTYKTYKEIFGEDFETDFGISAADASSAAVKAMSKALAQYASGVTRVFGASNAAADSYWKEVELPAIKGARKVRTLMSMADDAVAVDDTIGTIAIEGVAAEVTEGAAADLLGDFLLAAILL